MITRRTGLNSWVCLKFCLSLQYSKILIDVTYRLDLSKHSCMTASFRLYCLKPAIQGHLASSHLYVHLLYPSMSTVNFYHICTCLHFRLHYPAVSAAFKYGCWGLQFPVWHTSSHLIIDFLQLFAISLTVYKNFRLYSLQSKCSVCLWPDFTNPSAHICFHGYLLLEWSLIICLCLSWSLPVSPWPL